LTWRKPSDKGIFFPLSSWAEGRNRLYQEIFKSNYLYYIFLDEDIELKFTELYKNTYDNPWRVYERYLLKFQPAIGVPRLYWNKGSPKKIQTIYWYDGISIAVHKEALKTVFPIYDGDDTKSWWNPGIYFFHIASLLYKDHTLQFNTIEAINKSHRIYPRNSEWKKIDDKFKNCIINEKLKKTFQYHKHLSASFNGIVSGKNRSYEYKQKELSYLFNLDSKIFKRRLAINNNIIREEPYAVCSHSRLSYWADSVNKKCGYIVANFIFGPLVELNELNKTAKFLVAETKENIITWSRRVGLKGNL
jgi:hypothetical protein